MPRDSSFECTVFKVITCFGLHSFKLIGFHPDGLLPGDMLYLVLHPYKKSVGKVASQVLGRAYKKA